MASSPHPVVPSPDATADVKESQRSVNLWKRLKKESTIVSRNDILVERKQTAKTAAFKLLLQCFALQIRYGCDNDACTTPSCYTYRKHKTNEPIRRPTLLTARDQAFVLASTDEPLIYLCPHPLKTDVDSDERVNTYQVAAYIQWLQRQNDAIGSTHTNEVLHKRETATDTRHHHVSEKDAPSPQRPIATQSQSKIDKGSLVQNLFNTANMASWFDPQDVELQDLTINSSGVLVLTKLSGDVAFVLSKILSKVSASHDHRKQSIVDFVTRSIRYNLSSPTRLLEQWYLPGPQVRLTSLSQLPINAVVDADGNVINSIFPMTMPILDMKSWWELPNAPDEILGSMWHALDAVFVPPPAIADSAGAATGAEYMPDEQAARIIFIAILALVFSLPKSDPRTLAFALVNRGQGESIPIPRTKTSEQESADSARRQAGILVADAFESSLTVRLAEKVVAALATRRAHWCALRDEDGSTIFPIMSLVTAYLTQLVSRIVPEDDTMAPKTFEGQRLLRIGLAPGPILLEWFKTVFRIRWNGEFVVDRWKGAGAVLDILKDVFHLYGAGAYAWAPDDTQVIIPTLGARLKPHEVIPDYLVWMENHPSGSDRQKNERHLLQFPFVFEPLRRTNYFRVMLYYRMHQEWQASRAVRELHSHFSWLVIPGASEYRCADSNCNHAMCERLRFQNRQAQRWNEAGYGPGRCFPSNFWNRDLYLRNKLGKARAKFLLLDIERQSVLESAFDQLWGRELRELLKPLKVVMRMDGKDEDAADHGGVSQEFFRLVLGKAFDPEYGLFVATEEQTRMNWFQPLSSEPLETYELLGLLFGMAVYNGITLPVNFPFAMYQILSGRGPIEQITIRDAWPSLYKSFQQLAGWQEEQGDVEEIFGRDFAFSFEANGVTYTIDMLNEDTRTSDWPRSPGDSAPKRWTDNERTFNPVTFANRFEFILQYKAWLVVHSVRPQLHSFVKGFSHIIPRSFTSFMTPWSLALFVQGNRHIDVAQLMAATSYATVPGTTPPNYSDEYSKVHPTVQHFWSVVKKYDQSELQRLLTFVTASSRVPVQGYRAIGFSIEKHGDINMLPTSSTCFGKLFLPPYESEETLAKMLGIAINEGMAGFGFM